MNRKKFHVLLEKQVKCLVSPVRKDLLSTMILNGPLTIRELAKIAGKSEQTTYYQVRVLHDSGLFQEVGVRGEGRQAEKLYDAIADGFELPDESTATRNVVDSVRAILRQASREFEQSAIDQNPRPMVLRTTLRMSSERHRSLCSELNELIQRYRQVSDSDGELFTITTVVSSASKPKHMRD